MNSLAELEKVSLRHRSTDDELVRAIAFLQPAKTSQILRFLNRNLKAGRRRLSQLTDCKENRDKGIPLDNLYFMRQAPVIDREDRKPGEMEEFVYQLMPPGIRRAKALGYLPDSYPNVIEKVSPLLVRHETEITELLLNLKLELDEINGKIVLVERLRSRLEDRFELNGEEYDVNADMLVIFNVDGSENRAFMHEHERGKNGTSRRLPKYIKFSKYATHPKGGGKSAFEKRWGIYGVKDFRVTTMLPTTEMMKNTLEEMHLRAKEGLNTEKFWMTFDGCEKKPLEPIFAAPPDFDIATREVSQLYSLLD